MAKFCPACRNKIGGSPSKCPGCGADLSRIPTAYAPASSATPRRPTRSAAATIRKQPAIRKSVSPDRRGTRGQHSVLHKERYIEFDGTLLASVRHTGPNPLPGADEFVAGYFNLIALYAIASRTFIISATTFDNSTLPRYGVAYRIGAEELDTLLLTEARKDEGQRPQWEKLGRAERQFVSSTSRPSLPR